MVIDTGNLSYRLPIIGRIARAIRFRAFSLGAFMATAHIAFVRAMDGSAPVLGAIPHSKETITTSGTSQATTITAGNDCFVDIALSGGNAWVKIGAAPTASAGNDWFIIDGAPFQRGFVPAGSKVAIINA